MMNNRSKLNHHIQAIGFISCKRTDEFTGAENANFLPLVTSGDHYRLPLKVYFKSTSQPASVKTTFIFRAILSYEFL